MTAGGTDRRRVRRWLGGAAVVALALVIGTHWRDFAAASAGADLWLLAALLPVASALTLLAPIGWHLVLRSCGVPIPLRRSVEVWMVSAATRFVPGGIWTFAGRLALTREDGIAIGVVGLSLYLETILIAGTSLAIGLPALLLREPTALSAGLALAALAALVLLLRPRTLRFLLARLPVPANEVIDLPHMLPLAAFYCAYWLLWGFLFAAFVAAFAPYPPANAAYLACTFALAYCAGFVSFIFPGGLGVREGVLFALLTPLFPAPVALAIGISLRLWMLLAEAPVLAAAVWLGRRGHARGLAQDQDV